MMLGRVCVPALSAAAPTKSTEDRWLGRVEVSRT